jgi:3-hydroxyacyl-[acyl-carrier-protein] dehydratase
MNMDINEILNYLPHRYPFLLIDKVIEFDPGKSLVAIKNVTINEPFFAGHFPQMPIMPGVLILEAMAQATCILANKSPSITQPDLDHRKYLHLFAGIDNARFKRMVEPGDQLRLSVQLLRCKQGIWKFSGEATVDNELVCAAEMISARKEINRD